jgi:hypothetical protein
MRIRSLLALAVVFAAAPAAAQDTQTYRSEAGFSVELPAHWTRMPDSALDVPRRSNAGSARPIMYEAAYRAGDAASPEPPVVFLAWGQMRRKVTAEEFGAEFATQAAREEREAPAGDAPSTRARRPVETSWDAEDGIAWVRTALRPEGRAPAVIWLATTLHPAGDRMIALTHFGGEGEDEDRIRADLRGILLSLRVD